MAGLHEWVKQTRNDRLLVNVLHQVYTSTHRCDFIRVAKDTHRERSVIRHQNSGKVITAEYKLKTYYLSDRPGGASRFCLNPTLDNQRLAAEGRSCCLLTLIEP